MVKILILSQIRIEFSQAARKTERLPSLLLRHHLDMLLTHQLDRKLTYLTEETSLKELLVQEDKHHLSKSVHPNNSQLSTLLARIKSWKKSYLVGLLKDQKAMMLPQNVVDIIYLEASKNSTVRQESPEYSSIYHHITKLRSTLTVFWLMLQTLRMIKVFQNLW